MEIDILKEYASLEAMETKELLQVWNRHFDVPHLEHYAPDAVCTDLNTDDPVE